MSEVCVCRDRKENCDRLLDGLFACGSSDNGGRDDVALRKS